jgi:hypothetical protein
VPESLFAALKNELLHRQPWPSKRAARTAVFEFVEGFHSRQRRHSTLGFCSPAEFGAIHEDVQAA